MDSHVRSVHDQYSTTTQDPLQHPGGHLGGEDEPHEKKSVLKKVKAKAKKIKDTIASKAHGHGHDEHGQGDQHEDEEEEYDEDEEVVQDPEVHGAPMYESAAAQNFMGHHQDAGLGTNLGQNPGQHRSDHRTFGAPTPPNSATGHLSESGQSDPSLAATGHTAYSSQPKPTLGERLHEDLSAPKHDTPANCQTKTTDPSAGAGGVGGEEAGVTPVLQKLDKMHIYDDPQKKSEHESRPEDMNVDAPATQPQQGGGGYISSVTSAVTGTAIAAKNAVASKMGYGGNGGNQSVGSQTSQSVGSQTSQSTGPQTGQSAQPSSYTEKLSSATHVITDKAAAAKNVVASKLGYGGSTTTGGSTEAHPTGAGHSEVNRGAGDISAKSGGGDTAPGYGKQIADKLAPVYGTVAGAGSAVMSKMPGLGSGTGSGTGTGQGTGTGTGSGTTGTGSGYFAEKLKPGEEDKALSDVITGAFGKRGVHDEEPKRTGVHEAVSDAIHKRNTEEEDVKRENKPMGKVTESEEVAKRLGSSEEEKSGEVPRDESKEGVVDKFKGAFTNWFGKGGEMNPSQAFNDHSQTQGAGEQQQGISREGGEKLGHEGERGPQSS